MKWTTNKTKSLLTTFLAFIVMTFSQCKNEDNFIEHDKLSCDLIDLSETYDPVCGCDGKTYKNEGYAQCEGGITKYKKGKCKWKLNR